MGWFDCREEAKKKTDAVLGVSQPETAHPDLSYQKQFFLYQGEAEGVHQSCLVTETETAGVTCKAGLTGGEEAAAAGMVSEA